MKQRAIIYVYINFNDGVEKMKIISYVFMIFTILLFFIGCEDAAIDLSDLDILSDQLIYVEEEDVYITEENITLPKTFKDREITWSSSSSEYISSTGIINKPNEEYVFVTLTAIIDQSKKDFFIKVMGEVFDIETYKLFFESDAKNNGYINTDVEDSIYFSYEITIQGMKVSETYILLDDLDFEVNHTYQLFISEEADVYELVGTNKKLYKGDHYIELYEIGEETYQVLVFTDESFSEFESFDTDLYQNNRKNVIANSVNIQTSYWDLFQISFMGSTYYLGASFEAYAMVGQGYYFATKHFVYILDPTYHIVLQRDEEKLIYNANVIYDIYTSSYVTKDIDIELVNAQTFMGLETLVFNQTEQHINEFRELIDNDDYYSAIGLEYSNGQYIEYYRLGDDLLIANAFNYQYLQLDQSLDKDNYLTYILDEDMTKATKIYTHSSHSFTKLNKLIDQDIFSYATMADQLYLKSRAYELSSNFSMFLSRDSSEEIYIRVYKLDSLLTFEFYSEELLYVGAMVYMLDDEIDFDLNSFETIAASDYHDSLKPMTLGYTYAYALENDRNHIFRIVLEEGTYAIDSDILFSLKDINGDILDIELHHGINYSDFYFVVDEPLDAFLTTEVRRNSNVEVKIDKIPTPVSTAYDFKLNEGIEIQVLSSFDEAYISEVMEENRAYKIVFEASEKMYLELFDGQNLSSIISDNKTYVTYVELESGQTFYLNAHSSGILSIYLAEDDDISSSIDDPYDLESGENEIFMNSRVFDPDYFRYTFDEGILDFNFHYGIDLSNGNVDINKASWYQSDYHLNVYDENNQKMSLPITTPGTYSILTNDLYGCNFYYIEVIHEKDIIETKSLPLIIDQHIFNILTFEVTFDVYEKSYIEFNTDYNHVLILLDLETNETLWHIKDNFILTLDQGSYMITKAITTVFDVDLSLEITNLGSSNQIAFNSDIIYTYPDSINLDFTYINELVRLEFEMAEYVYYDNDQVTVYFSTNQDYESIEINDKTYSSFSSNEYQNITNIFYIEPKNIAEVSIFFKTMIIK